METHSPMSDNSLTIQPLINNAESASPRGLDSSTNWMVHYARNFLVRMQIINTATLKLNPHEGSVKDVFGASVPFLNDVQSEDLKKVENLTADNLAVLLHNGQC